MHQLTINANCNLCIKYRHCCIYKHLICDAGKRKNYGNALKRLLNWLIAENYLLTTIFSIQLMG